MLTLVVLLMLLSMYVLFRKVHQRVNTPLLNPLLLAMLACIAFIKMDVISYAQFSASTQGIDMLLKPAIIALALPLYRQIVLIKQHLTLIIVCCFVSASISFVSAYLIYMIFDLNEILLKSLTVRSITTPLAMSVTSTINGIPGLSAAIVMMVGIIGSVFGATLLKMMKIHDPMAQGMALGASSHVLGAATATQIGFSQGAFASVSLVLCGIATSVIVPLGFFLLAL